MRYIDVIDLLILGCTLALCVGWGIGFFMGFTRGWIAGEKDARLHP